MSNKKPGALVEFISALWELVRYLFSHKKGGEEHRERHGWM